MILSLSVIRGIGLAIVTVSGGAVFAELVPQGGRGVAGAVYGLGSTLPSLIVLPTSVFIASRIGFIWVFVGAASALLGIIPALRLGTILGTARAEPIRGAVRGERASRPVRGAVRPATAMFAATMAAGGAQTFLPQVTPSGIVSSSALLMLGVFVVVGRWALGGAADRISPRLLEPGLLVSSASGLAFCAVASAGTTAGWLLIVAMVPVGFGYGALLNVTLLDAFDSVERHHLGAVSVLWNTSLDSGTAIGAVLLGVTAQILGFATGFVVLASLVAATACFLHWIGLRVRRESGSTSS